jgi:excisionase family DNA binding protein
MVSKPKPSSQTVVPDKLAYTIPEAAAKMSTNISFVRRMVHQNKLKVILDGNAWLIPHQEILNFLQNEARTYDAASRRPD